MTLKCLDFNGVPLVSHAGSTTYFPARVVRQLGGLQMVPKGTVRTKFEHTWREDQTSIDRLSEIERVMTAWQTTVIEHPYFPEHPTQDERDFQATEEYILRFYRWGPSENDDFTDTSPVESSTSSGALVPDMAIQAELANLRAERDRLRRERIFLHRNSHTYGIRVLTTGGAPPVSHTLPIKNGRGKSTRCLRGKYTTDAGSFSTAHSERTTTAYLHRRATSTSWGPLGPSPTTDFNEHVTTAGIRATATWVRATTTNVCAVVGHSSTTTCP
ncbi:hypothetical protein CRG98_013982 [Punica granatum]|uniref:Uncharacterized protein n=1 Tax=Punica granatum TaxID=22663 RepID=A0A2I0KAR4_PUNGR|nr:hypothetical protein CRG98_013982 [Punica granatum]